MLEVKLLKKTNELVSSAKLILEEYNTEIANNMQSLINGKESNHRVRFMAFRTTCLNFICKIEDEHSDYYVDFEKFTEHYSLDALTYTLSVLQNLEKDIESGWIGNLKDLISADVFADFMEMADYLIEEKFKDPAAVIIGSLLEEKLRNLCNKNGISVSKTISGKDMPKKASSLNDELASNNIYNANQGLKN